MAYLKEYTGKAFVRRVLPDGEETWRCLHNSLLVILTIPNGWTFAEQELLWNAAVNVLLIKEGNKHDDLYFVTEGEALVHWALAYNQSSAWLSKGVTFAVVDASGSTVDSTLYKVIDMEPKLILHEACASECVQVCPSQAVSMLF